MKFIPIVLAVAASVPLLPTAVFCAIRLRCRVDTLNNASKKYTVKSINLVHVNNPGRVRRWTDQKEVPCYNGGGVTTYPNRSPRPYNTVTSG